MTMWVSVETPRKMLRAEGRLPPQAGGAEYVTELTRIGAAEE
jgi:hypothetical protein